MKKIKLKTTKFDYATEEAYKSLRTNIQFCGTDKKIIALTSCVPNEGKSAVSLNLAISLAESGKKVLMIDADLRKSVMLSHFEVDTEVKGFTHFLSRQSALIDVIYETNIPELHVILAGPVPPNPSELLGSNVFKDMLSAVESIYDYIIIDTPPLGSVIDAAVIAEVCSGAIMVIKQGFVSHRFAREVKEQLAKSGCPVLGVVLNMVDTHEAAYGYYCRYVKYGAYKKYGEYGEYGHKSGGKK